MKSWQQKCEELISFIDGIRNVYILIYSNVDPDSIASAWGLKEFFRIHSVSAQIGYTGKIGRIENKTMIDLLNIPVKPFEYDLMKTFDKIAIVDAQPEFFKNAPLPRCDIVIDHHPKKSKKKYPFSDIQPQCLATASIVTNYLIYSKKKLTQPLATALYYGIQIDRKGLLRKPTLTDQVALNHLDPLISHSILSQIESSQYTLNLLDYFSIAFAKRKYASNCLYAHIGTVSSLDICSQIADFFIKVQDVQLAVVSGVIDQILMIAFRSQGDGTHSGKLAEKAFGMMGSAGGHNTMARAEIPAKNFKELSLTQDDKVELFIIERLANIDTKFSDIVALFSKVVSDC